METARARACTNSDDGVIEAGVPGRQSGYLCVQPGKTASFTLGLKVKPEKPVHVNVQYCSSSDYCIDGGTPPTAGGGCKDCVTISNSGASGGGGVGVEFTPQDWNISKTLTVQYLKSGDSQFKITSPDYFIKDSQALQFSTCACKAGEKCSNECERACGPRPPPPPTPKPGQVACYCAACGSSVLKNDWPKGTTCAQERTGCSATTGTSQDGCYSGFGECDAFGDGAICHCGTGGKSGYCAKKPDNAH
jgi:hypothetical protein